MELFLFVFSMVGFVALYLVSQVYLFWTLIFVIIGAMIYIAVRYPQESKSWPIDPMRTIHMVVMLSVIFFVFILVGPKPVPFIGSQLFYTDTPLWEITISLSLLSLAYVIIVFAMIFILIFAFLKPLGRAMRKEQKQKGEDEGEQSVGAG
ncbi:MAG: hypothetical protein V5A88_06195 [Candidatus Thermoplasmatota archaeon]